MPGPWRSHILPGICRFGAKSLDHRVCDIAPLVGVTERVTQAILSDLDQNGYVDRVRVGRRNRYRVRRKAKLGQLLAGDTTVGDLIDTLTATEPQPQRVKLAL